MLFSIFLNSLTRGFFQELLMSCYYFININLMFSMINHDKVNVENNQSSTEDFYDNDNKNI